MITFLLVVHVLIAIALVGLVLMQQSEGGASSFVSGSMGGFMSIRGTGNFMTRATGILATAFFASSILLAIMAKGGPGNSSIMDKAAPAVKIEAKKEEAPAPAPAAPKAD